MAGWGTFLGTIASQFQSRIERLKNERIKLIDEKIKLEAKRPVMVADVKRIIVVNERVSAIDKILANKASD